MSKKYTKDKTARSSLRLSPRMKELIEEKYGSVPSYFSKKTEREFGSQIKREKKNESK